MSVLIINIDAPDVDACAAFYEGALHLERVRRLFDGAIIEMRLGAQLVHILPRPERSPAFAGGGRRTYARHWTPVHLDVVVEDLEGAVARAVRCGAAVERAIAASDWGRIAGLADPFGNGFCLIEPSAAGYDAVADPPRVTSRPASRRASGAPARARAGRSRRRR